MRMTKSTKRALRTFQTRFPLMQDAKFDVQRVVNKMLRRPFESDFDILRYLPACETEIFVDVGANRGQSIEAMRLFNGTVRIEAFEPNRVLAERLQRRYNRDGNTRVNAFGLGDGVFDGTLYVPYYRSWMFDGLASLDPESAQGWLNADRISGFDPRLQTVAEYPCAIRPLDSLDLNPVFIKIDVQGLEEQVLRGAQRTLERCAPMILLEDAGNLSTDLEKMGYREFAVSGNLLHRAAQRTSNSLFVTQDKLERLRRGGVRVAA